MTLPTLGDSDRATITHLANALTGLAALAPETRAELLELAGSFAQHFAHPDAVPATEQIDFACAATQLLRGPLLAPTYRQEG